MKILRGYLWKQLSRGYLTVVLSVAALLWMIELLQVLEDVGGGGGALVAAIWQAARVIPETVVDLLPLVVVLASSMVLGAMHRDHELTVMRACGIPLRAIARTALLPALVLALLALVFLQFGAPLLYQGTKRFAGTDVGQSGLWHPDHGLWVNDNDEFLNVRRLELGRIPADIGIYRYDSDGRLVQHIDAARAIVEPGGLWRLEDVRIRRYDRAEAGEEPGKSEWLDSLEWRSFLSTRQFELLVRPPASLPPTDLWRYLDALERRALDSARFSLLFWRRLALPLACLGMVLVATAAATASLRSQSLSVRAAVGTGLGLAYQLLVELASFAGLAVGFPALAVALLPPLALIVLGSWLLSRADSVANG